MTFNLKDKSKPNYPYNTAFSPLLKDSYSEANIIIGQIENGFLDLNKFYNRLQEFNRKILTFTRREYEKNKDDVHDTIQLIPNILIEINSNYDKLESLIPELNDLTREKLEMIKQKINVQVNELPNLINQIYEKEKKASLKLRNIKISEPELDDSLSIIYNRKSDFNSSKFILKEVIENQTYLEKRREELESIKKVTAQLKEITVMMGQEVKNQGQQLNEILEDIEAAKSNVEGADSLVSEAERRSRSQLKKVVWITIALFMIAAAIISLIVVLSLGK